jgi:endo-1,4-beta-xylanase
MSRFHAVICFAASVIALTAQPLRQLTDQRGIRLGAAADPSHFTEAAYAETLAREFSQLEPENAMKFGPIHPGRQHIISACRLRAWSETIAL